MSYTLPVYDVLYAFAYMEDDDKYNLKLITLSLIKTI